MSDQTSTENTVGQLIANMRDAFQGFLADQLKDAQGDVKAYVQQIGQEYARYLWRAYKDGDKRAEENLHDLKSQVMLIAVKRSMIFVHGLVEQLQESLMTAAQFGLKLLVVAAARV